MCSGLVREEDIGGETEGEGAGGGGDEVWQFLEEDERVYVEA